MGFSIRVMPGVRISASRRGVSTSIGPRIARVHVGPNSIGMSTGIGPFGFSQSISTGGRRNGSLGALTSALEEPHPPHPSVDQAFAIKALMDSITTVHRATYKRTTKSYADDASAQVQLESAFSVDGSAAAAVGVFAGEGSLVVRVPHARVLPTTTTDGVRGRRIKMRPLTAIEVDAFYTVLVTGCIVATAREALAACPSLASVRVVAIREGGRGIAGVEVIGAARFSRERLDSARLATLLADQVVADFADETAFAYEGRHNFLAPIDLAGQPELRSLVEKVDIGDLSGELPT